MKGSISMRWIVSLSFFTVSLLNAKQTFTSSEVLHYLDHKNPFVYEVYAQEYIYKEKEQYRLGEFDTKFSLKYDKKDYPTTTGEFYEASFKKPIENGMEFIVSYREADGTQEYNNIQTGENGEMLVGVNIPVLSLIHKTNTRKMNLELAQLESIKYHFNSQNKLRILYLQVLTSYYNLLYYKALVELEKKLFDRSKKREFYIAKRVKAGTVAEVTLVEAKQQIMNRKQRLITAKNSYEKSLTIFLQYLNTSREEFFDRYVLEDVLKTEIIHVDLERSMQEAIKNRSDLQMLQYEKKKLKLQKKNAVLLGYPNINIALYGVHDFKYNNGFKLTFNMDFPFERRKYYGKTREIDQTLQYVKNVQTKRELTIGANLTNIVNSLETVEKNILYALTEVKLAQKLEKAEYIKYKSGTSNLFMLNQREVYSLEVNKKILKYKLDYLRLKEIFYSEIGVKRSCENI